MNFNSPYLSCLILKANFERVNFFQIGCSEQLKKYISPLQNSIHQVIRSTVCVSLISNRWLAASHNQSTLSPDEDQQYVVEMLWSSSTVAFLHETNVTVSFKSAWQMACNREAVSRLCLIAEDQVLNLIEKWSKVWFSNLPQCFSLHCFMEQIEYYFVSQSNHKNSNVSS